MGHLENGHWKNPPREASTSRAGAPGATSDGAFVREPSTFRKWVAKGGEFEPKLGRYHLYAALACPWAGRATLVRKLKKLDQVISVTLVHPDMLEQGWTFEDTVDPNGGYQFLHELYTSADPLYSGKVTVPVLWDKKTSTIVNNESADIIRMFNSSFDEWADTSLDLYPGELRVGIDDLNERTYAGLNNAVYRAGFATSQAAYQAAVWDIFKVLDELEERLGKQRFLMGDRLTEADVRVFTTAVRFDVVYYGHFKCNVRHFWDYPNLWGWLRDIFQMPGVAETVDFDDIKRHYYFSHKWVNPSGIVPVGPSIDLRTPHSRQLLSGHRSA